MPAFFASTRASVSARKRLTGRLFNYANNAITILGINPTTLSALLIVISMVIEVAETCHVFLLEDSPTLPDYASLATS